MNWKGSIVRDAVDGAGAAGGTAEEVASCSIARRALSKTDRVEVLAGNERFGGKSDVAVFEEDGGVVEVDGTGSAARMPVESRVS